MIPGDREWRDLHGFDEGDLDWPATDPDDDTDTDTEPTKETP